MLHQIIDRRLSGKNKSIANRERFLRRYKNVIQESISNAIHDRSIKDIEHAKSITIPKRNLSEPSFHHGRGGRKEMVHTGNEEFVQGDRIARPSGNGGNGKNGNKASNEGEGQDDFVFELSRDEFMEYFFEDLELPHLVQTNLMTMSSWKNSRAGYSIDGSPSNIDIVRSLRSSLGRRIAIGSPLQKELRALEQQYLALEKKKDKKDEKDALLAQIEALKARIQHIPFIDPFDLRYVNRVRQLQPSSRAVMFCIMDVSGSMDEQRKDLSKRFFILLYLFLTRNYEHIEVVFIRHHTRADEVDEETFFHSQESGGTVVSSALELMHKIISTRYPSNEWNIYAAQASDGDNWNDDSPKCRQILEEKFLPLLRYFAYIQVAEAEQNLWEEYQKIATDSLHFAMKKASSTNEIYPVFRELFEKHTTTTA